MSERENQLNNHVGDQIDAYALGILEDEAVAQVEAHLEGCADCQRLLRQAREVVALLALAPRQVQPPARLKQRILTRIAQEERGGGAPPAPLQRLPRQANGTQEGGAKQETTPLAHERDETPDYDPNVALPLPEIAPERQGLMENLRRLLSGRRGAAAPGELPSAAQTSSEQQHLQSILQLLRSPHPALWELTGTREAPQARAHLLGSPEQTMAVLIVSGLEPLPPERDYQLWFLREGKPVGSAVFDVRHNGESQMVIHAPRQLGHYDLAAITPEPAGGSPGPTGPIIIAGELKAA